MNYYIMAAITFVTATPVYATHAYHHERCRSKTHTMDYDGEFGYSDSHTLTKIGFSTGIKIWENEVNEPALRNEFTIVRSKGLSSKIIKADCGPGDDVAFESVVSVSRSVLKFTMTGMDEALVDISKGTLMTMTCKTTDSYPVQCRNF